MELIIDISKWQGNPAFGTYKGWGATGVIHKAGGSNDGRYTDSQYAANAPSIRAAGLDLGHYWFNGTGDPETDADYFIDNLVSYQQGDFLLIDVESEGSMPHWTPAQTLAFGRRVTQRTSCLPAVYMSASVTREGGWEAVAAEGYPLMVAAYGANDGTPGTPPNIGGWSDWEGWQYTSLFHGLDASQFKSRIGSSATPIQEDDMFDAAAEQRIKDFIIQKSYPLKAYQTLEVGSGTPIMLGAPGVWYHVPDENYLGILVQNGVISSDPVQQVSSKLFLDYIGSVYLTANDDDRAAIEAKIDEHLATVAPAAAA